MTVHLSFFRLFSANWYDHKSQIFTCSYPHINYLIFVSYVSPEGLLGASKWLGTIMPTIAANAGLGKQWPIRLGLITETLLTGPQRAVCPLFKENNQHWLSSTNHMLRNNEMQNTSLPKTGKLPLYWSVIHERKLFFVSADVSEGETRDETLRTSAWVASNNLAVAVLKTDNNVSRLLGFEHLVSGKRT